MEDSIQPQTRPCTQCEKVKAVSEFPRNRYDVTGYYSICKVCLSQRRKNPPVREVLPKGMKRCTECKEIKPITEFTNRRKGGSTKLPKCKKCLNAMSVEYSRNNPEKIAAKAKREYEKHHRQPSPHSKRRHKLAKKYGLTIEHYEEMYNAQFGLCAICGLAPKDGRLVVDHCHVSGIVRGLLCTPCNWMLGMARDNPTVLMKAAKYLRKHQS